MLNKLILIAALLFASAASAAVRVGHGEYTNRDWAFSVRLPREVKYEVDAPPNPNHGFRIPISAESFVWVNADSTDDKSLSQATASEAKLWTDQGCSLVRRVASSLGGKPAVEMQLKCIAGGAHAVQKRIELLVALESPRGLNDTTFTVGAAYPEVGRDSKSAQALFRLVSAGFRIGTTRE